MSERRPDESADRHASDAPTRAASADGAGRAARAPAASSQAIGRGGRRVAFPTLQRRGASPASLRDALAVALAPLVAAPTTTSRRVEVFVGPPGVGKTTTIAKIAAQERARGGQPLGLVAADGFRVGAVEQLRALRRHPRRAVHAWRARPTSSTRRSTARAASGARRHGRPSPSRRRRRRELLRRARPQRRRAHASRARRPTRRAARRAACSTRYADAQPVARRAHQARRSRFARRRCVGLLRERGLPISYLGTGQRVPEDLSAPRRQLLAAACSASRPMQEHVSLTGRKPRAAAATAHRRHERQGRRRQDQRRRSTSPWPWRASAIGSASSTPTSALGNVDVLLGLTPDDAPRPRADRREDDRARSRSTARRGVRDHSGRQRRARADGARRRAVGAAVGAIDTTPARDLDFLLIDTAAGHRRQRRRPRCGSPSDVLVVTSLEPAAVVDAYAVIKISRRPTPAKPIGVVVNAARDADEAGLVFRQIDSPPSGSSAATLRYDGYVVEDPRGARSGARAARRSSTPCRRRRPAAASAASPRGLAVGPTGRRRPWPRDRCRWRARRASRDGGAAMRVRTATPRRTPSSAIALVMAHVGLVKSLAQPAGAAPAVAGRIVGAGQRRRARPDRRGQPLPAVARRAVRRVRAPPHPRRDARCAARPRLGAALGAPAAPRRRRRHRRLRHELGREPEAEEIAAALGVSIDEYDADARPAARRRPRPSIRRARRGRGRQPAARRRDRPDEGPHAQLERAELRAHLAEALGELPERERQILALYYEEELTLAEIGEVIGVGESRVSQLRTQAIARLRSLHARMRCSRAGGALR